MCEVVFCQDKRIRTKKLVYLFSIRSSKVLYVKLILIKWRQIKNIKHGYIQVDKVHQLLKQSNNWLSAQNALSSL